MKCTIGHCNREAVARGFCTNHYYAFRKHGDPLKLVQKQHHGLTLTERFWQYVNKQDGCWNWLSYKDPNGYGRINYDGKPYLAHRLSYQINCGEIPVGKVICHRCDNPSCVNPEHLFLGEQADNVADMHNKGRARKRGQLGTEHHASKLSEKDIPAIRASTSSVAALAEEYGVSRPTIHAIRVGKTWRHVK